MRAVIQRVSAARVWIAGSKHSEIGRGLLVLVGVEEGDTVTDATALARKILDLRVFEDGLGRMNRAVTDVGASILVVSQFTLLGDCRKGRRPSFARAAPPEMARQLYDEVARQLADAGVTTATGMFQATMDVELTNQGPVTLLVDTRKTF
jgi:D-tyrosyl-tRNA(Tyr) deacylase